MFDPLTERLKAIEDCKKDLNGLKNSFKDQKDNEIIDKKLVALSFKEKLHKDKKPLG